MFTHRWHGLYYYFMRIGDASSSKFNVPGSIFNLPPYDERKNHLNSFLLLPTEGIEPGPPAQQASMLSITP